MVSAMLDSSVLIDCLRGRSEAIAFLSSQAAQGKPATHVIVAAEILAGARDKREQAVIESFLDTLVVLPGDASDALNALELFKRYRLSNGVDWPDCQIAATALRLGLEVHTLNVKHFATFAGLHVIRAY